MDIGFRYAQMRDIKEDAHLNDRFHLAKYPHLNTGAGLKKRITYQSLGV